MNNNCLPIILVRLPVMCSINSFEKMQLQLITVHSQNTALNYLETHQIPLRAFIYPACP